MILTAAQEDALIALLDAEAVINLVYGQGLELRQVSTLARLHVALNGRQRLREALNAIAHREDEPA